MITSSLWRVFTVVLKTLCCKPVGFDAGEPPGQMRMTTLHLQTEAKARSSAVL